MSSDLLAEGRRLLAAAMPAPWTVHPYLDTWEVRDSGDVLRADRCGLPDAEFIAWARNNGAALLDELAVDHFGAHLELAEKYDGLATDRDLWRGRAERGQLNRSELIDELNALRFELRHYRAAMPDVRRLLADFGITNPPLRLKALLAAETP